MKKSRFKKMNGRNREKRQEEKSFYFNIRQDNFIQSKIKYISQILIFMVNYELFCVTIQIAIEYLSQAVVLGT